MEDIVERTTSVVARWKQWLAPETHSRRPDALQAEYQPLAMPDESSYSLTKQNRPPIVFDTPTLFFESIYARFLSLWTPSFTYALLGGQLLSFCATCASVATAALAERHWSLPNTQIFFTYFAVCIVFTSYTIHRYGFDGWRKVVLRDGWKYFLLAFCDAEGNFLAVKAYTYTDLLSCMLLTAWAIPVCLFSSWIYMRTTYHWTQILGVVICIAGLCLLVMSDLVTKKDEQGESRGTGDALMIVAATMFGISNATEEFFVRHSPLYEVVGQFGMWAMVVSGTQAFIWERHLVALAPWDSGTIGLLAIYTLSLFTFFSLAPLLFRTASSSYLNMSLLTSDFYGLIFGLLLFHYSPYWLYFPAFVVIISGLLIYFWHATPEEQGESDIRMPSYISQGQDIHV